jgi:hypothetical protein
MRQTAILLALLALLSGVARAEGPSMKPSFTWPLPEGWKAETIPFPLEFAPDVRRETIGPACSARSRGPSGRRDGGALFPQGISLRPRPWAGFSRPVGPAGGLPRAEGVSGAVGVSRQSGTPEISAPKRSGSTLPPESTTPIRLPALSGALPCRRTVKAVALRARRPASCACEREATPSPNAGFLQEADARTTTDTGPLGDPRALWSR